MALVKLAGLITLEVSVESIELVEENFQRDSRFYFLRLLPHTEECLILIDSTR